MKKTLILFILVAMGARSSSLAAQELEATATAVRVPAATIPKLGPLTVTVELQGGQKIVGALTDMAELPFRGGSVGEVKIMLSEVAGIKLAAADDPSTSIIFKNGDSITGATDLKMVTVDTEWGSAKINGSSIVSLILLPDLKWTSVMQANGKRWSLQDIKVTPAVMTLPTTILPNTTFLPGQNPASTPNRPSIPNRPSTQVIPN